MLDTSLGTGPQALEGSNTNSASVGAYPVELFQTPLLDLTKTYSNIEIIPARPGYFPVVLSSSFPEWVIESVSGTQTSPPTIQAGNDAGHVNTIPNTATTPSNALVNAAVPPTVASGPAAPAATVKRVPNTPVFMDVTVAAQGTGGYSCLARLSFVVCWIAVS